MAKMGGMELLCLIKLSYPMLPVIMMTGYPSVEVAVEAMKEGAVDFITKPIRLDALQLAIARIGGNHFTSQSIVATLYLGNFRVHRPYLPSLARSRNFPSCTPLVKPFKISRI